jgi:hypothetical protein
MREKIYDKIEFTIITIANNWTRVFNHKDKKNK